MFQNIFSYAMTYGESLRERRKEAGLTQDRLAELVTARGHKISGAYVSMIERGYDKTRGGEPTRVHKDFVVIAADLLQWNINAALIEADYAPLTDISALTSFIELTQNEQRLVTELIEAIRTKKGVTGDEPRQIIPVLKEPAK